MRIIICGAGQVGYHIARQLSREDNQITLIDKDEALITQVNNTLDVQAIAGYASYPDVLERAGAADADMLIAVTYSDEVNMVACDVAHSLFSVPTKIARIRSQNYLDPQWKSLFRHDKLPIDVIISPEMEVADAILRRLQVPGTIDMLPFADDKVRVLATRCEKHSPLLNLPLHIVETRLEGLTLSILGAVRNEQFLLATPEVILGRDDIVYFACKTEEAKEALALFGHEEKEARRIIVVGGGNVGLFIAKQLEAMQPDLRIKLIEISKPRAEHIVEQLERTVVINGSALDREILTECGIESAETIICVTNDDKVNILASLLAKRYGCQRSIALVNNNAYIPLLGNLGLDVIVNPRESTVSSILQHVRRGKIRAVHAILDGTVELIEAEAIATSPLVGKQLGSLHLPKGIVLGMVLRGENEILVPNEKMILHEHDRVILLATSEAVKHVEKFFSVSLEFF